MLLCCSQSLRRRGRPKTIITTVGSLKLFDLVMVGEGFGYLGKLLFLTLFENFHGILKMFRAGCGEPSGVLKLFGKALEFH